jgi:hypothetical protein
MGSLSLSFARERETITGAGIMHLHAIRGQSQDLRPLEDATAAKTAGIASQ